MSMDFWNKVTENISDKFTDEAAEYFASHAPQELGPEDCTDYRGIPTEIKTSSAQKPKNRRLKLFAGIGAVAAAVLVLIGTVVIVRFNRPDLVGSQPTDVTTDTADSTDSTDTPDTAEPVIPDAPEDNAISMTDFYKASFNDNKSGFTAKQFADIALPTIPAELSLMDYLTDGQRESLSEAEINALHTLRFDESSDHVYGIYMQDLMTTTAKRYDVYRSNQTGVSFDREDYEFVYLGCFELDGKQFSSHVDPVITENYIFWHLDISDDPVGKLAVMKLSDGEVFFPVDKGGTSIPAMTPTHTGTDEITWFDKDGNMCRVSLDVSRGGTCSETFVPVLDVLPCTHADLGCNAEDRNGYAVICFRDDEHNITNEIETGCPSDRFDLIDADGNRLVWCRRNADGTDTVYCHFVQSGMRYKYKLDGNVGHKTRLVGRYLLVYDLVYGQEQMTLVDFAAEKRYVSVTPEILLPDPTAWPVMDLYKGDDPELLEFCTSLSPEMEKRNEQYIKDALAGDTHYDPESVQDLLENGNLGYYANAPYYVKADHGEFWMKSYAEYMGMDSGYHEFYFRDENGFRLLCSYEGGMLYSGFVCDGEYLYYMYRNTDEMTDKLFRIKPAAVGASENCYIEELYDATLEIPSFGQELWDGYPTMYLNKQFSGKRNKLYVELNYFGYDPQVERVDKLVFNSDMEIISNESTGYGVSYYGGKMYLHYKDFGGSSGSQMEHNMLYKVSDIDTELMELGNAKLADAVKLFQINNGLASRKENDTYSGDSSYAAIASQYGGFEGIEKLYNSTFAPNMYDYGGAYYATSCPSPTPWMKDSDRSASTLWSELNGKMKLSGDKVYVQHNDPEMAELWTVIDGILEKSENRIVYLLCTIDDFAKNGDYTTYSFQHSEMILEKLGGEWLITQIRPRLGNEYGTENREELIDAGVERLGSRKSYVDIQCDFIEKDGGIVIGTAEEDIDFDGAKELLICYTLRGERRIKVMECIEDAYWQHKTEIKSELFEGITSLTWDTLQRYDGEGGQFYYFTLRDDREDYVVRITCEQDEYNPRIIRYNVTRHTDVAPEKGEWERITEELEAEGMTVRTAQQLDIDWDNDQEYVFLVDAGGSNRLYIYENKGGLLRQESFITSGMRFVGDDFVLKPYSGMYGNFWYYEFDYSGNAMTAHVYARIEKNYNGYEGVYLYSNGTISYTDIAVPFTTEFWRKGWDYNDVAIGVDYGDISKAEYEALIKDLKMSEYVDDIEGYTTLMENPRVYSVSGTSAELDIIGSLMVQMYMEDLSGYGSGYDTERTFSVHYSRVDGAKLYPIADIPENSKWNVTAEERAFEEAWIVEPDGHFAWFGKMYGLMGGSSMPFSAINDNPCFLLWRDGNEHYLRSRAFNGRQEQYMTNQQLSDWVEDNLSDALALEKLFYLSCNYDNVSSEMLHDGKLDVTESEFNVNGFTTVAQVQAEVDRLYACVGKEKLVASDRFSDKDGRLYVAPTSVGFPIESYAGGDTIEILSQNGDMICFSIGINSMVYPDQGYQPASRVITIKRDNGTWKLTHLVMLI
ncbi:MAG: hypothetical protein IJZ95_08580 [Oscillospiraceae bacterium]|nr:hypothetical protein [Oscillospiraceae bacterium]